MLKKISLTAENDERVARSIRVTLDGEQFDACCARGRGIEWLVKWSRHKPIPTCEHMTPEDREIVSIAAVYCAQWMDAQ
jgi:hypothetical protein